MKKSHIILAMLLIILATAFAWIKIVWSADIRYKIIVTVETPEGIKSGYTVREVELDASPILFKLPESTNPPNVKGEAAVVDLGERGQLFVLIDWDSYNELLTAFPSPKPMSEDGIRYYKGLKNGETAPLSFKNYPIFVNFKDANNPMTVQKVDPQNLAATYGGSVHLKGIEIEITNQPITHLIIDTLPWLSRLNGNYINGKLTAKGAPLELNEGHFRRDIN